MTIPVSQAAVEAEVALAILSADVYTPRLSGGTFYWQDARIDFDVLRSGALVDAWCVVYIRAGAHLAAATLSAPTRQELEQKILHWGIRAILNCPAHLRRKATP